jgi:integrase
MSKICSKNLFPLLGSLILTKLRPAQISAAYTTALASGRRDGNGGVSPRTVHHLHTVLKSALTQAVKWELLTRNPADAVDPPKVERKRLDAYDMAQTATILAVLCGLRRGEIAALRWKAVDLTGPTCRSRERRANPRWSPD